MQLFVVKILFTSSQQFESSNLSHRRICGISKTEQGFTGRLIRRKEKKEEGRGCCARPDSAQQRCGRAGVGGLNPPDMDATQVGGPGGQGACTGWIKIQRWPRTLPPRAPDSHAEETLATTGLRVLTSGCRKWRGRLRWMRWRILF
jgi:hypothetical protein